MNKSVTNSEPKNGWNWTNWPGAKCKSDESSKIKISSKYEGYPKRTIKP
jgi:hypothetical protein